MSWLGFEEDCIVTSCVDGHVRIWQRPQDGVNGSQVDLPRSKPSLTVT